MHIAFSTLLLIASGMTSLSAATYYVATNGSDNNPGTISAPFRHIGYGLSRIWAGDALLIRGGTYNEYVYLRNKSGTANSRITVGNYNNESVTVRANTEYKWDAASGWPNDGYGVWWMKNCHHFYIYGIALDGRANDSNNAGKGSDWRNTNGFYLSYDQTTDQGCTFIEIQWCNAYNCGLSGFAAQYSDRIIWKNCAAWSNALTSTFGGSGFSIFLPKWKAPGDSDGYHNRIENCKANWNLQDQVTGADRIDGSGIILDGNDGSGRRWAEGQPVLVRGNTCENNSGTGIIAFKFEGATITGNTVKNSRQGGYYPFQRELCAEDSAWINFNNNVITPRSGSYAIECRTVDTLWSYGNNLGGGPTRQWQCTNVKAWQ